MAGAFHRVVRRGISPSVVAEGAGEEVLALARPTSAPFATIKSFGRYARGETHPMGRGVQLRRVAALLADKQTPGADVQWLSEDRGEEPGHAAKLLVSLLIAR